MKRIEFNIEYYNAHPDCKVVTRDGRTARILCTDRPNDKWPVVAVFNNGTVESFSPEGRLTSLLEHFLDLFIEIETEYFYKFGVTTYKSGVFDFTGHYSDLELAKSELRIERVANSWRFKIDLYRFDMEAGTFEKVDI